MTATKRKNINPRIERKITRISSVREVKQTFLIICEGVNTEPDYFNAFRLTSANVKALGQGMGTLALVHKAIHIKEQEKLKGRTYNQNWVVFDKDDFPENDLFAFKEPTAILVYIYWFSSFSPTADIISSTDGFFLSLYVIP